MDPKPRSGRKPKLTKEVTTRICALVANGLPKETAAGTVGVHRVTLFHWRKKGNDDRQAGIVSRYSAFADDLYKAECSARATVFARWKRCSEFREGSPTVIQVDEKGKQRTIEKGTPGGAEGDWRSYREMLRCMDPEHWGERVQHEFLEGELTKLIRIVEEVAPSDVAEKILAALVSSDSGEASGGTET
jgi:hypothetical protein